MLSKLSSTLNQTLDSHQGYWSIILDCLQLSGFHSWEMTPDVDFIFLTTFQDIAAYRAKGKSEAGKKGPGRPTGSKKKNEPEDEEEEEEEEDEDEEEEDEDEE